MLKHDFNERPHAEQILEDPYWNTDLSNCITLADVIRDFPEICDSVDRNKSDNFAFNTRVDNFEAFYAAVQAARGQ